MVERDNAIAPIAPSLGGFDLLRHLFAIAVIVQHGWSSTRYPPEMRAGYDGLVDLVDGAVFGFFLLAGLFAAAASSTQTGLTTLARRKAKRLLLPYAAFSVIYAISGMALGQGSALGYLERFFLGQGSGMQLYFLPLLFAVELSVAAVLQALPWCRERVLPGLTALALFATLAIPMHGSSGNAPQLWPFFLLAYLVGLGLGQRGPGSAAMGRMAAFLLVAALALGVMDARFFDVALVFALVAAAGPLSRRLPARLPGSGGVYLLHTPVTNFAISTLLVAVGVGQWANVAASVMLSYLLFLGLTLAWRALAPKGSFLLLEQAR